MAQQYTIDEAKAQIEAAGHQWTPEIEANLRAKGRIRDTAKGTPWYKQLANEVSNVGQLYNTPLGASMQSNPTAPVRDLGPNPLGDWQPSHMGGVNFESYVNAMTAGHGPQVLPGWQGLQPDTGTEKFTQGMAGGAGAATAIAPLAAGGAALLPAAGPFAAGTLGGGAALGAGSMGLYAAAQPAETAGDRVLNTLKGAGTGAVISALPFAPGLRTIAANPVGRAAIDYAAFTGMNKMEGQPWGEAAGNALSQTIGMAPVNAAAGTLHIEQKAKGPKAAKAPKNASANVEADMAALEALRTAPEGAAAPESAPATEAPKAPEQPRMTYYGSGETVPSFSVTEVPGANPGDPVRRVFRRNEPTSISELAPKSPAPGPGAVIGETPAPEAAPAPAAPSVVDMRGRPVNAQEAPTPEIVPPGYRKPSGDVTLGMGPLQVAWEAAVKAGKGRGRQLREGVRPDWERLKKVVGMPVEEMPDSVPFSGYNNGQKRWEDAMSEIEAAPRPVKDLTPQSAIDSHMRPDTVARTEADNAGRIKNIPDKAAPEVKGKIAQENVDLTNQALHPDVVAQLDAGFSKNIIGVRGNAQAGVTDPTRKMQQVNDGRLAAPIEMQQIHGGLVIDSALHGRAGELGVQYRALKEANGISGKSDLEIAGKLRNQYNPNEPIQAFLNKPGVMDLLRQSGKPQQMLEYVKGLREMENALRDDVNRVRRSLGQSEIGNIDEYFAKVAAKPKFFDIAERTKRSKAKKQVLSSRTSDTEQAFNARGLHRSSTDPNMVELDGRQVPRNWNAEEVFQGYVDTMLRSIGGDLALNQSMILVTNMENRAQVLRSAGDTHAADQMDIRAEIIRNIAQQQWNHQLYGLGRIIENGVNALPGGSNIRDTLAWNKRQFDNTKYRLNPRFTFGVQGLSTWTPVFRDPVAGLLALKDIALDPKAREYAMSTPQAQIKSRPHSALRSQIEGGGSLGEVIKSGTSKRNKVRRTADFVTDGLTQGMENFSDMFAALADYHLNNKNPNLTERQRVISSGQAVFKTQSAFTFEHRPSILNSKFLQGMFPAQGFKFEVVNQLREAFGEVGVDSRLYGAGRSDQARDAFAILASAAMQNWFQNGLMNMMAGKDAEESFTPESLRDAVMTLPPVLYAFLPGSVTGNDRAQYPLPAGQVDQLVKAGQQKNLRKTIAVAAGNWGGVGGAAVNDILRGRYSSIGIGSKDWQDPTSDFGDGGGNSQPTTSRTVVRPQVQSRKTVTRAIPARRR